MKYGTYTYTPMQEVCARILAVVDGGATFTILPGYGKRPMRVSICQDTSGSCFLLESCTVSGLRKAIEAALYDWGGDVIFSVAEPTVSRVDEKGRMFRVVQREEILCPDGEWREYKEEK